MKYKLKPEFEFFKEIYFYIERDFQTNRESLKHYDDGRAYGYVGCFNNKTGFVDDIWLNDNMFEKVEHKVTYVHTDEEMCDMIDALDINDEFQAACETQWGDETNFISVSVKLTDYDEEKDYRTPLYFLKKNIDRVISEE